MSVINFAILELVGPILAKAMLWSMEISGSQVTVALESTSIEWHTER